MTNYGNPDDYPKRHNEVVEDQLNRLQEEFQKQLGDKKILGTMAIFMVDDPDPARGNSIVIHNISDEYLCGENILKLISAITHWGLHGDDNNDSNLQDSDGPEF